MGEALFKLSTPADVAHLARQVEASRVAHGAQRTLVALALPGARAPGDQGREHGHGAEAENALRDLPDLSVPPNRMSRAFA